MAVVGRTLTVGTSAVLLADGGNSHADSPKGIAVHNQHATQIGYIGGTDAVLASTGFPIDPGATVSFNLISGEETYIIADGASTEFRILETFV